MNGSRRIRWLLRRASAMGPAEIGLRASRGMRDRLRRRSEPAPQEELLTFAGAVAPGVGVDAVGLLTAASRRLLGGTERTTTLRTLARLGVPAEETVQTADRVLDGALPAFGHTTIPVADPPSWHADPSSGLEWPADVWWSDVDFRFHADVGDPRYVWEVNRHLHLGVLARAHLLTREQRYAQAAWRHMTDWVRRNPPHFGINWASPLEVAIRLISWTSALSLIGAEGAERGDVESVLTSCALQARHVSDNLTVYGSSRNNHLIGEAAGLLAAGVAFPFLDGADAWALAGRRVLSREIPAQLSADGISLEQTFHYQVFVIEFALVALACARAADLPFDDRFTERVGKAAAALDALADGAAAPPNVGDEDGGRACLLDDRTGRQARAASAAACLATRGRLPEMLDPADLAASVWLLGGDEVAAALEAPRLDSGAPTRAFPDGGYFVLGDGRAHSVVDCGPLGLGSIAAHGHADCLALEVARDGEWLVVDPGTCCYHRERRWRDHFRSTGAHNTVSVDGLDQSEMLGPFLWGARASANASFHAANDRFAVFAGSHDGYRKRLGAVHERTVLFVRPGLWLVLDVVRGAGVRLLSSSWQLAPGLEPAPGQDGPWRDFEAGDGRRLRVGCFGPDGTRVETLAGREDPIAGWVSEGFGQRAPAAVVRAHFRGELTAGLLSVISVGDDVRVDVDLVPDGTGAGIRMTSGARTARALMGTYRNGDTTFRGLVGLSPGEPGDVGTATLGAGVREWRKDGRAVDFEPVPNELHLNG